VLRKKSCDYESGCADNLLFLLREKFLTSIAGREPYCSQLLQLLVLPPQFGVVAPDFEHKLAPSFKPGENLFWCVACFYLFRFVLLIPLLPGFFPL